MSADDGRLGLSQEESSVWLVVWSVGLVSFCPERLHSNIHEPSKGLMNGREEGVRCRDSHALTVLWSDYMPWEGQGSHLVCLADYRIFDLQGRIT